MVKQKLCLIYFTLPGGRHTADISHKKLDFKLAG